VGTVPTANRATYGFITALGNPTVTSEHPAAGQSGFIGGVPPASPVFDAHFVDQLELYLNFQYKPMPSLPKHATQE
jgi:acyl-homoserine lactone acylase PvdQ